MSTNKTKNMKMHSWSTRDTVIKEELNANFNAIDSEFGRRGINIVWKGADSAGTRSSYSALVNAVNDDESSTIYVPKGVYLIDKNITIPSTKRITLDRGARLKPAKGITITINSTIEASIYDWIFDVTAGGLFAGTPKVGDIYPHWFGAVGDGLADDTAAFQAAMNICNKKYRIFIPQGTYRIRQTITNNSRGMYGVAEYVDDGQEGSLLLWDPINTTTDLLPCIKIESAGIDAIFENFSVIGKVGYHSRNLSTWINKSLFDQDSYAMFAPGAAAIEIAGGAKPVFRCIRTNRVKVGLLLNSTDGHITSYDCTWNGLIGIYCYRNSEDYYFEGGGITGAFCGIMIGILEHVGHYGGIALTMKRVHMGYSPYGIYQVKDSNTYDNGSGLVGGMSGSLESVRFEQIGEAAIKLLQKSITGGLHVSGLGMSWSSIETNAIENTALPDSLKAPSDKQKYAIVLGNVTNAIFEGLEGKAIKSSAAGAKGTAYIAWLEEDVVLTGLDPELTFIERKNVQTSLLYTTPLDVGEAIHAKAHNALSHGNLLKNPEVVKNWNVIAGTGVSLSVITDLSNLPVPFHTAVKAYVDKSIGGVLKVTPNGNDNPFVSLPFNPSPLTMDGNRFIGFEYFILTAKGRFRSRLEFENWATLYDETFEAVPNVWTRISCKDQISPNQKAYSASFFELSSTQPTYIAAVMVSYDFNGSYSPYNHAYAKQSIESGDSFILTDKATGIRCKIELVNGNLKVTALT